jgi:hypothetical protein
VPCPIPFEWSLFSSGCASQPCSFCDCHCRSRGLMDGAYWVPDPAEGFVLGQVSILVQAVVMYHIGRLSEQ